MGVKYYTERQPAAPTRFCTTTGGQARAVSIGRGALQGKSAHNQAPVTIRSNQHHLQHITAPRSAIWQPGGSPPVSPFPLFCHAPCQAQAAAWALGTTLFVALVQARSRSLEHVQNVPVTIHLLPDEVGQSDSPCRKAYSVSTSSLLRNRSWREDASSEPAFSKRPFG